MKLSKKQAVEALWEAILKTSRAYDGDPVQNWKNHNDDLHKKCDFLNSLGIKSLRYKSSNGTDFSVGLIPQGRFCAASEISLIEKDKENLLEEIQKLTGFKYCPKE